VSIVTVVIARAGIHGCSDLSGNERFHIEVLASATGEIYAYAVQYRTLSITRLTESVKKVEALDSVLEVKGFFAL
jgi:hypothetical protein